LLIEWNQFTAFRFDGSILYNYHNKDNLSNLQITFTAA